jgi:hypothetical protein
LHAQNANEEIIRQPRISALHLISLSLISIADSAANTRHTGKQSDGKRQDMIVNNFIDEGAGKALR